MSFESRLTCPSCGFAGGTGWDLDVHSNSARCPRCRGRFTVYGQCPECAAVGIFKVPAAEKLLPVVGIVRAIGGRLERVCPSCGRKVPYREIQPVLR